MPRVSLLLWFFLLIVMMCCDAVVTTLQVGKQQEEIADAKQALKDLRQVHVCGGR